MIGRTRMTTGAAVLGARPRRPGRGGKAGKPALLVAGCGGAEQPSPRRTGAVPRYGVGLADEVQFAPQVFDYVNVIALAAEAAGSTDPAVFKDQVVDVTKDGTHCTSIAQCQQMLVDGENIDYDGASGPLEFVPEGEPGTASIEIYSFTEQGELQTVDTVQASPPAS